jgi:hypothetical protein
MVSRDPAAHPNLIRVGTPSDLVKWHFTAIRPNELWCVVCHELGASVA